MGGYRELQSNQNNIFMRPGDRDIGYLEAQKDFDMKNQEAHHLQERAKLTTATPAPTGTLTLGFCG